MKTIHFNVPGDPNGGGPSVFVWKTATELRRRGYKISGAKEANGCICIINTGKVFSQIDRNKTRVLVRIDGIYNDEYNKKFNRSIRPDMTALHNKLKSDIPAVDHVLYQSRWSKERIDEEIVPRKDANWSIVNNGIDTKLFKPGKITKSGKEIKLIHVGKMRDDYMMRCLVGTYNILKAKKFPVTLTLVGTMDGACQKVLKQHGADPGVRYIKNVPNNKLPQLYSTADIYIGPRQGSSCDNVIAEAQACGLPVVIPEWGGNKDMVINGQTGMVVKSGRWDYDKSYISELANGVESLLDNLEYHKNAAAEHAKANLTIDKMVDNYLAALKL